MKKLLWGIIATGLVLTVPQLATADDAYSRFIKTQLAEFEGDNPPDNCKEKKIEVLEKPNNKATYELCAIKDKPIYMRKSYDGSPVSVTNYSKGELVGVSFGEGTMGVGFRNNEPVVKWNSGEFGKRGVNWKLTPEDKALYRKDVKESKRILKRFGVPKTK
jgi:hypothetical protein